ncbi:hypothetical protein DOTSEDRAFT_91355 [Dothistroma septosporum NZE10]|uniref:FAD-binding domain-containing protein n=1 Tax=Dothistroma septosporum (strain NZE10 / CBS 128990) TaxID=675120 RepID=N1PEN8_DOTSN|nr:hypothetical protein DOTSEDRAFT_91355 [Dothistroma septosporum NZE10]
MASKQHPFESILIVGAGPSGLLLAILLAQQIIPSLVLEAWSHLDTRLRATPYGVPATRIFRHAGLLPDFRAAWIPRFPAICWRRVADGEKLIEIDMSLVEDEEDRMTVLQLGIIIQIMYRHCMEKFGPEGRVGKGLIEVRFEHKVLGTGQDEERRKAWVDVEVGKDEPGKRNERIEADYVVGCDGASSAVRRSLYGHEWPGQTWDCRFVVQNVFYNGFEKHGWDGGNYMVDHNHSGVTYGDPEVGLSDDEYLKRRPWHLKAMLPGSPDPHEYRIEQTNMYNIHNRCVSSFNVGRILLAADAAHVINRMGGYGCMTTCLDIGGLADCLIGYHQGRTSEEILQTYADVRREIFLKYVDARSIKNLDRVRKTHPWTVVDTDKFFGVIKDLNKDKQALKEFLMKVSSIEYDFTQHYNEAGNASTNTIDGVLGARVIPATITV